MNFLCYCLCRSGITTSSVFLACDFLNLKAGMDTLLWVIRLLSLPLSSRTAPHAPFPNNVNSISDKEITQFRRCTPAATLGITCFISREPFTTKENADFQEKEDGEDGPDRHDHPDEFINTESQRHRDTEFF